MFIVNYYIDQGGMMSDNWLEAARKNAKQLAKIDLEILIDNAQDADLDVCQYFEANRNEQARLFEKYKNGEWEF